MFKNKKGSEVMQSLIIIAIMGALAISAISAITNNLQERNNTVLEAIDTNLDVAP